MSRRRDIAPRHRGWAFVRSLLTMIVVVGAGAAGWFGLERFVDAAPMERSDIWADLPFVDTTWDSFVHREMHVGGDEVVTVHHAATGSTRVETRLGGQLAQTVEAIGTEVWETSPGGTWAPSNADVLNGVIDRTFLATPVRVTDIIPPAADDFVTVTDRMIVGDSFLYELTINTTAFAAAAPLDHTRWVERFGNPGLQRQTWSLRVRSDGYITQWSGLDDTFEWSWHDLEGPPMLESPISDRIVLTPAGS